MAQTTCWNCEAITHMTPHTDSVLLPHGAGAARAYQCDNCNILAVAVARRFDIHSAPGANKFFETPGSSFEWHPVSVLGKRFVDVPEPINDAASEAYACYSIRSYRAAILMARSVVEAVAKEQGERTGSLYAKIDALEDKRIISPLLKDQAHEIRHLGNEMAHGDFTEPVTEEDCDDVLNFMSVLLETIYQQPAKLTRHRERRNRPSQ